VPVGVVAGVDQRTDDVRVVNFTGLWLVATGDVGDVDVTAQVDVLGQVSTKRQPG
jgi:hypothetical protein